MCTDHKNICLNSRRHFLQQIASLGTGMLAITWGGCASRRPVANLGLNTPITPDDTIGDLRAVGCSLRAADAKVLMARLSKLAATGHSERALLESSGDGRLDQSFGILLADMAEKFNVRPGFAFYDYNGGNNALAFDANYLPNTTGTVLFGRTLLQQMLQHNEHGDIPIMGTCAHEFGHIVQYQGDAVYARLLAGQKTQKRVELHADFLAGYYIGQRGVEYAADELIALGRTWEELGDDNFSDPLHHGTPEERLRAMEAGYQMAAEAGVGVNEAVAGGLYYLRA